MMVWGVLFIIIAILSGAAALGFFFYRSSSNSGARGLEDAFAQELARLLGSFSVFCLMVGVQLLMAALDRDREQGEQDPKGSPPSGKDGSSGDIVRKP